MVKKLFIPFTRNLLESLARASCASFFRQVKGLFGWAVAVKKVAVSCEL
jgi:hypothetical protein